MNLLGPFGLLNLISMQSLRSLLRVEFSAKPVFRWTGCAVLAFAAGILSPRAEDLVIDYGFAPQIERNGGIVIDLHREVDGGIWIAGSFSFFEGKPSTGVVKLTPEGAIDETFTMPGIQLFPMRVFRPLADGSALVAGSVFTIEGEEVGSLFKLDPSGQVDRDFGFPITEGTVYDIAVRPDGKILVGGSALLDSRSTGREAVVCLNADGSVDPDFAVESASSVYVTAIAVQPDGKIIIGGGFTIWEGVGRSRLARLNADGGLDDSFVPTGGGWTVNSIVVMANGKLLVGRSAYPGNEPMLQRLAMDGALEKSYLDLGNDSPVESIYEIKADSDGGYWAGGVIGSLASGNRFGLVHLDAAGEIDDQFEVEVSDRQVTTLEPLPGGDVLIGLSLSVEMGWDAPTVVRLDKFGNPHPTGSYQLSTAGYMTHLGARPDGGVIVGGLFDRVDHRERSGVAFFSEGGALLDSFKANTTGSEQVLNVVEKPNGNLLLVGHFNDYDGQPATTVVETTSGGEYLRTFSFPFDSFPTGDLALLPDGDFVVAYRSRNPSRWRLARFRSDGSRDDDYASAVAISSQVRSLVADDQGRVVVAGSFGFFGEVERSGLVRLDADGEVDLMFNPQNEFGQVTGEVVAVGDGTYLISGDRELVSASGQSGRRLVRTTVDGRIDSSFEWDIATYTDPVNNLGLLQSQTLIGMTFRSAVNEGGERRNLLAFGGRGEVETTANVQLSGGVSRGEDDGQGGVWLGGSQLSHSHGVQPGVVHLIPVSRSEDFFANRRKMAGASGVIKGDNAVATMEPGEVALVGGAGKSLWFEWTAPTSGQLSLRVGHTVAASRIRVATGDAIDALQVIAEGDDAVEFWAEAGQTLLVQVDSVQAGGPLEVTWGLDATPQILVQPESSVVRSGQEVEFMVGARGSGLSYQWQKHGFAIEGATGASLMRSIAELLDAGYYDVVVSNSEGAVTSERVRLTVYPESDPGFLELDPDWSVKLELESGQFLAVDTTSAGGILLVGEFLSIDGHDTSGVARLDAQGRIDPDFSASLAIQGSLHLVTELPDGKFLLVGDLEITSEPGVRKFAVRLMPDGSIDPEFSAPDAKRLSWQTCGVDSLGRIYGTGALRLTDSSPTLNVFRLMSDGAWDEFYQPNLPNGYYYSTAGVSEDGQLYLDGFRDSIQSNDPLRILVNLDASGARNESFDPDISMFSHFQAIKVSEAGDIYVTGLSAEAGASNISLWRRYSIDGLLDPDYGGSAPTGIILEWDIAPSGELLILGGNWNLLRTSETGELLGQISASNSLGLPPKEIARTATGEIVVVGGIDHNGRLEAKFARVASDFSTFEVQDKDLVVPGIAHDIQLDGEGGLLIGGRFDLVNGAAASNLVKLTANGLLDPAFAASGQVDGAVRYVRRQADGDWIVSGSFLAIDGEARNGIGRLNAAGVVDGEFNPDSFWNRLGGFGETMVLEPLPAGQLLVGGMMKGPFGDFFESHLFRLNEDGALDETFGGGLNPQIDYIFAAKELLNGDYLLGGFPFTVQNSSPMVRINPAGEIDRTYAPPGIVGKGVVAGISLDENEQSWVLQQVRFGRHTSVGLKDRTAMEHGVADVVYPNYGDVDLLAQADGRLIVGGEISLGSPSSVTIRHVFRLNEDGRIDDSFRVFGLDEGPTAMRQADDGSLYFGLSGRVSRTIPLRVLQVDEPVGPGRGEIGSDVTLTAVYEGIAATYQWFKNGILITGETGAELRISQLGEADVGRYRVGVTNAQGVVFSAEHFIGLVEQDLAEGYHRVQGVTRDEIGIENYTIANEIYFSGEASQVRWSTLLPDGWSVKSVGSGGAVSSPMDGTTSLAEWTWHSPANSPLSFTYELMPNTQLSGRFELVALVDVQVAGVDEQSTAKPDPLIVRRIRADIHSADTDGDLKLNLRELLRVIELYNTRNGTTRTGGYREQASEEDGFSSDGLQTAELPALLNRYHSADLDRDARVSLAELLGVIELYNTRAGSTRTGSYRLVTGSDSAFEPDL